MAAPPKLYKYEAFSAQSLLNLKSQVLYFGSPLNFNDPYDCALKVNIRQPSDEEVELIRCFYLKQRDLPSAVKDEFTNTSIEKLRISLMRAGAVALHDATNKFLQTKGVTCFAEFNNDLLMWSHYGGKYKGFCLEFSTEFEPFEKIWQVHYRSDLPTIELAPLLIEGNFDFIQALYCTKSEAWGYEGEWRAIHVEAGTKFGYPAECLTGVFFGPEIDQHSLEIVCLILGGQNDTVKFWRGSKSTTEFKVKFEPITYTSFLEAKRKGLR